MRCWPAAAVVLALSAGTVFAHEQREGAVQWVVGFLNEPAYEGQINGVYLKLTRQTSGEQEDGHDGAGMSMDMGDDGPGHHGSVEAESPMSVKLTAEEDPAGGVNVNIMTQGFTFAPESVNLDHVPGEGHAHIYADGVKLGRVYSSWTHVSGLAPGSRTIRVTLNANTHEEYIWNGQTVEAEVVLQVGQGADHHGDNMMEDDAASSAEHSQTNTVPVEGAEQTLQVEVTHIPTGDSKVMNLRPLFNAPGEYVADLIPTAPGAYQFRFVGTIEGEKVEEVFLSEGAGGDFDDVRSSVELQFPVQLPEIREIEGAVRGAQNTAVQAQDTALAAEDSASSVGILAIVGIVLGAVGTAAGVGGVALAMKRR